MGFVILYNCTFDFHISLGLTMQYVGLLSARTVTKQLCFGIRICICTYNVFCVIVINNNMHYSSINIGLLPLWKEKFNSCPDYLGDSVQACNSDPARTRLRSASSSDYTVPRTRTRLGVRAFSVAGPVVWNSPPAAVREADSLRSFKRKLKNTSVYFMY